MSSSSGEVKCPKCQCPFQVPEKGVEDLPANYFTAGVVTASIKKASIDPNNVRCVLCEENEATVHCVDCPVFMCNGCKKGHLRLPVTAHHKFITVEEALKGDSSGGKIRVTRCQKHPHQEINSYCKTDQTAVCPQCVIDSHIGHDVNRLVDISKGFKDTISTLVNKVRFLLSFFPFSDLKTDPL